MGERKLTIPGAEGLCDYIEGQADGGDAEARALRDYVLGLHNQAFELSVIKAANAYGDKPLDVRMSELGEARALIAELVAERDRLREQVMDLETFGDKAHIEKMKGDVLHYQQDAEMGRRRVAELEAQQRGRYFQGQHDSATVTEIMTVERLRKRIAELEAAIVEVATTCRDRARAEVIAGAPAGQLAYERAAELIGGVIEKEASDG